MPAAKRTKVRDMEFESIAACAAYFKVRPTTVRRYIQQGRLDQLGLRAKTYDGLEHPVTIRDRTFKNQREAAAFFDVDESTISVAKQRGRLDYVGIRSVLS